MTYDNWKTTNPDDAFLGPEPESERTIVCDVCEVEYPADMVCRADCCGIETWACDDCREVKP